jgi:superfamily II DNA or RNA helicase
MRETFARQMPDSMDELKAEIAWLRDVNTRLTALLERHGIPCPKPVAQPPPAPRSPESAPTANLSSEEKVALFRRLFWGRTDVYPVRWESKAGKSGYSPACANEWRVGVCEKPRIKCGECTNRLLIALTDKTVYDHLAGHHTVGVYPLLPDNTCHFLAVDFDGEEWRGDARAFAHTCGEFDVPVALEISRSGNGAHAWIFFSAAVPAGEARALGTAMISRTCVRTRQLRLSSYDRLFPNQDTMPKGGFGNLIALPLQKKPREQGFSVFVDDSLAPYPDQWAFLASIEPMPPAYIVSAISRASVSAHPLDVAFITEEDQRQPWKRPATPPEKLPGPLPARLTVTLANQIYFEKSELPQPLANRLIRLAAFQNPEFYQAQAMRLPVWNKPRVIGCAENYPRHIGLPRGCVDAVQQLLRDNGIALEITNERNNGQALDMDFVGTLRPDQETAVARMLKHDTGVLSAPTAFGKTVTAAAIIARRGVNTLILVHRGELLNQWRERLCALLGAGPETANAPSLARGPRLGPIDEIIGTIGGGRRRPTGKIDIAVMQSLSRKGETDELVERYGHIVVDECHHLSAFSFEAILKRAKARFVLGLTATPVRRDGRHPIIFMQCGPVRHEAPRPEGAPQELTVVPRFLDAPFDTPSDAGIQEIFRHLATDSRRNERIVADIITASQDGRRTIVLTERTSQLEVLVSLLTGKIENLFVLHGRMGKNERAHLLEALNTLPAEVPRTLLATGRLIGEGFDHPPLDTLVLAMPVSWKGTLQQYAGRLHREHAAKTDVRIHDYVDTGHPALRRMWDRRQRGYRAMGYRIVEGNAPVLSLMD